MSSGIELTKIKSLTTEIELFSARGGHPLEVSEYGDKNLVCLVPRTFFAPGQLVTLDGKIRIADLSFVFCATGKLVRSLDASENLTRFEIDLNQYDKDQWKKFLDQVNKDQDRVTALLEKMRSDD